MELRYHKWLELQIVHEYFVHGYPSISLVPSRESTVILEQNNIRINQRSGSFGFYLGSESPDPDINSQLENLGTLEFELLVDDPLFFNYTDLAFLDTESYYTFRNVPETSEIQIENVSDQEVAGQLQSNNLGIVRINVAHLHTNTLNLTFYSRSAFQKYKIVIPGSRGIEVQDIVVKSPNGELYSGPENSEILPGQPASVFTSKEAIPLRQHSSANPNLVMKYRENSSEIKNMELDLPNPSPESLRLSEDGNYVTESIIYV